MLLNANIITCMKKRGRKSMYMTKGKTNLERNNFETIVVLAFALSVIEGHYEVNLLDFFWTVQQNNCLPILKFFVYNLLEVVIFKNLWGNNTAISTFQKCFIELLWPLMLPIYMRHYDLSKSELWTENEKFGIKLKADYNSYQNYNRYTITMSP